MHNPWPGQLADLPVRRLTRADLVSCADLCEDRGWARDEHRWGLLLSVGTGYGIDDPGGKGLAAACAVTANGTHTSVGMLLVADRHARQGLGRRLMHHVIEATGETPLSLYATTEGQPLYERLGFAVVGRADRVSGHFRPVDGEGAQSSVTPSVTIRPARADDLKSILRLDADTFGADRTHLITRLPAFSDKLLVAEDDDTLVGYAAIWPSGNVHSIGPLVAPDTATAKALVTTLAATTDRPLRTDIDVRHHELLDWLGERGLEKGTTTVVMIYRSQTLPGDWTRRFAPLTVATG
ncbi:GNAT family N-acetyltransferase [Streptomyces fulvorobeus]|uniref:Acetyltransferase n=1 Tax=Streptomyces fulvorobeus TaxID=284028 RepID=A0A7J0C6V4_9ACTN|nr:GNAT family N-acetyltransferase [Streptomyces fulvorobeus]NYE41862.1 putative N-acetyltransferase YhbS [Streptomyces fulvorobeus]GFM98232.1 acetyltransferase [Streptomyces fulvorobeus]